MAYGMGDDYEELLKLHAEEVQKLRGRIRFHAINVDEVLGAADIFRIRCDECHSNWKDGAPESHKAGCLAAPCLANAPRKEKP